MTFDTETILAVCGSITGIAAVMGLGTKWITDKISAESVIRKENVLELEKKIDEETEALERKLDHKHANVAQSFTAINHKIDKNCDQVDIASKDIVRLTEGLKTQELQVREIKTELKESLHEFRRSFDERFDRAQEQQQKLFDKLEVSIREVRNVTPK